MTGCNEAKAEVPPQGEDMAHWAPCPPLLPMASRAQGRVASCGCQRLRATTCVEKRLRKWLQPEQCDQGSSRVLQSPTVPSFYPRGPSSASGKS